MINPTPASTAVFDGRHMAELRKAARKSRALLAVESNRSFGTIVALEQGKTQPKTDTLWKLAAALNVEPADLLRPRSGDSFTYDAPAPVGYGDGPYGTGPYGEDSDGI